MFNFILAAALATSLASFSAPAFVQPQQISTINEVGPIITISIDLGRVSKDCKGFGVCDVDIEIEISLNVRPNGGKGTAQLDDKGNLVVNVQSSSVSKETLKTYFSGETFLVEEDFTLSSEVAEQLGAKSYTIKAGIPY